MKLKWKQALSALLAIALMLSFAGCAKGASNTASSSNATSSDAAYTDEELAQVAVKVGDEYTITKGDILDEYDYMVQMYSYYGMSAPSTDEEIEAMQDSVIATLVSDKVQLYQAKLMGITLTDEEQADAEAPHGAGLKAFPGDKAAADAHIQLANRHRANHVGQVEWLGVAARQVAAAGCHRIIRAFGSGGRASLEVASIRKVLTNQARAAVFTVLQYQRAVGLILKPPLAQRGGHQRVQPAGNERQQYEQKYSGA